MSNENLETSVREYLDKFWKPREKSVKERIYEWFPRYNEEFADLTIRTIKNKDILEKIFDNIYNVDSKEDCKKVISIARNHNPSYESGLAIGYLIPDEDISLDEKITFEKGLKTGQIYRLKLETSEERKKIMRGMMGIALGSYYHTYTSPYHMSGDNLSLYENLQEILTYGLYAPLLYGIYPMIRHNLFCNDMHQSKKLITSGQFALHRNPFYFGIMSGFGLLLSKLISANILSENPNWLSAGIASAGLAYTINGFNNYTKIDEKVLEKQFGEEYREYKRKVPRFIPNFINLFRRNKKCLK